MQYPTIHKSYETKLSDWGPYSKQMTGIAHIENPERGEMLEFSVFPGQYRGALQVPSEIYQCNQFPWHAAEDLRFFTFRFELEWKDRVYCDVSYWIKNEQTAAVRVQCVNHTDMPQNICLHYMANETCPPQVRVKGSACAVDPLAYDTLDLRGENRLSGLMPDGRLVGEVTGDYVNAHALGDLFGKTAGDCAAYTVHAAGDTLYLRGKGSAVLRLGGVCTGKIELTDTMTLYALPAAGTGDRLTLTAEQPGTVCVDYIGFGKAGEAPEFSTENPNIRPAIAEGENRAVLTYRDMKNTYGIGWNSELSQVREFLTTDLATLMPYTTQNHVSSIIGDDPRGQYTDVFIRPIPLRPQEEKTFYAVLACGKPEEVTAILDDFAANGAGDFPAVPVPEGKYGLSQQLMRATMLTNVVFPVRLQGRYLRHFTPGKWWDSLYTWDNGFIELGFSDIAPQWSKESLSMYLTEPGNPHCAFIHHGSMVPVQAYVYKKLYDDTGDKEFLRKNFDSMRQYYDFYVGRSPLSNMRNLNSGLLCTFRYFYNSGGWDDYPPQKALFGAVRAKAGENKAALIQQAMRMAEHTTPASNTAHGINFARVMLHAAEVLGYPTEDYEEDIAAFTKALQTISYDAESGYFSYVQHDENGDPQNIMRCETGENFNMGLDGAYPLMADVCTPEQRETLAGRIMDPQRMWTDIGISVVDQSAPYYCKDGYWNGSVWMPHQWFAFCGMLEYAYDDYAARIAETGLSVWKNEVDYSYRCYEHFMVESGRGAGWHCFGGLSAPVVMWHASLYKKGHATLPMALRLAAKEETEAADTLHIAPCRVRDGEATVLYVPRKKAAAIEINGEPVQPRVLGEACMLHLPKDRESVVVIRY